MKSALTHYSLYRCYDLSAHSSNIDKSLSKYIIGSITRVSFVVRLWLVMAESEPTNETLSEPTNETLSEPKTPEKSDNKGNRNDSNHNNHNNNDHNWSINWPPVDILLRATGDAPIMKKKNWRVESDRTIGWISEFIKRYIKLEPNESLVGVFTIHSLSSLILIWLFNSFCT